MNKLACIKQQYSRLNKQTYNWDDLQHPDNMSVNRAVGAGAGAGIGGISSGIASAAGTWAGSADESTGSSLRQEIKDSLANKRMSSYDIAKLSEHINRYAQNNITKDNDVQQYVF